LYAIRVWGQEAETVNDESEHNGADERNDLPSRATMWALLEVIAPGSSLSAIRPLAGSYSNFTHLVEALTAGGSQTHLVVRRYVHGDRAAKSRLEFRTLAFLQDHNVPAPAPLYLDEDGAVLGVPGIVTSYVPGQQLMRPVDHPSGPLDWARSLATMLAKIHSIPCDSAKQFLLDASSEATWFLRSGIVPDYMNAHPDGAMVWQTVHDLLPDIQQVEPALVHLDYWRGNVLWDQGRITAVVDWEEAAYGDPGIDLTKQNVCAII
jgi:aminoglycoside phosphotransferase (APT) family kinase protein